MAELIGLKEVEKRVILIGVQTSEEDDTVNCLNELEELVKTAGAATADKIIRNQERIHSGTYLGRGKIEEVKGRIWGLDTTGVVCDDELPPAQLRNLEQTLDTKMVGRTMIILDIFVFRVNTSEGKIQVELTQLKHRAAGLVGLHSSLPRLDGDIGTRNSDEKKLEVGHHLIHGRIGQLKAELRDVEHHRDVMCQQRSKNHTTAAIIVGYANAGKSALLNLLTDAGILVKDKLFTTLSPTTRSLELPSGQQTLPTDTVGSIHKLPHHLIEAFRSTPEEAKYSDIILHVMDCSNPQMDMQIHTVYETLKQLEVTGKIMVIIYNKIDKIEEEERRLPKGLSADYQLAISAKTGEDIGELKGTLEIIPHNRKVYLEKIYPYDEAGRVQAIRKYGELLSKEYGEDGITVETYALAAVCEQLVRGRIPP